MRFDGSDFELRPRTLRLRATVGNLQQANENQADPGQFPTHKRQCILKTVRVRDVLRLIEGDGWRFHSQRSSRRRYIRPVKPGRVTISGKPGEDIASEDKRLNMPLL